MLNPSTLARHASTRKHSPRATPRTPASSGRPRAANRTRVLCGVVRSTKWYPRNVALRLENDGDTFGTPCTTKRFRASSSQGFCWGDFRGGSFHSQARVAGNC